MAGNLRCSPLSRAESLASYAGLVPASPPSPPMNLGAFTFNPAATVFPGLRWSLPASSKAIPEAIPPWVVKGMVTLPHFFPSASGCIRIRSPTWYWGRHRRALQPSGHHADPLDHRKNACWRPPVLRPNSQVCTTSSVSRTSCCRSTPPPSSCAPRSSIGRSSVAKNSIRTHSGVASMASQALRSKATSRTAKRIAGSALSNTKKALGGSPLARTRALL